MFIKNYIEIILYIIMNYMKKTNKTFQERWLHSKKIINIKKTWTDMTKPQRVVGIAKNVVRYITVYKTTPGLKQAQLEIEANKYTDNILNQNLIDEVDILKQKITLLQNKLDWQVSINNDLSLLLLRYEKDLSYYQKQQKDKLREKSHC